ncbi:hypothetical protein CEE34_08980 [Candidatus Aerophobetes bacterium Ae_b3a]|nr:MAG: hypothetical protein CEE34_08980 [Candidatus Aerophobetes bacterium Ae_b3a]
MKILTIRKGFQADHSSTSYEFFAIEKPLSRSERGKVASLSSRARPSRRRVSFIYHGEWSDLPGGWEPLMEKYYDVMYSESYDWWTLAMAFDADQKTIKEIERYEFRGTDDLGISVDSKGKRVIITIYCRLSLEFHPNNYSDYDYYEDDEEEDEEEGDEFEEAIESEDSLLNLLAQNHEYLKNGDYRLLYGVWQEYGFESEEEEFEGKVPLEPPKMDKLSQSIKYLLSALEGI